VALIGQIFSLGVLLIVVLAAGQQPNATGSLFGALGGVCGGIGLLLFYRGLAVGLMSIVAPISACSALVPVVFTFARGQIPAPVTVFGCLVAMIGVILASLSPDSPHHTREQMRLAIALALGSAIAFGLYVVLFAHGVAAAPGDLLWVVAAGKAGSIVALLGVASRSRRRVSTNSLSRFLVALILVGGLLDTSANGQLGFATTQGNLAVVGVLSGLYPAATVLLATAFLRERLRQVQALGVLTALAGVALIGAG
jgi:drug/metabolite transporter (DMT)-like permease